MNPHDLFGSTDFKSVASTIPPHPLITVVLARLPASRPPQLLTIQPKPQFTQPLIENFSKTALHPPKRYNNHQRNTGCGKLRHFSAQREAARGTSVPLSFLIGRMMRVFYISFHHFTTNISGRAHKIAACPQRGKLF